MVSIKVSLHNLYTSSLTTRLTSCLTSDAEALSGEVRQAGNAAEAEMNKEIRKMEDLKDDTYGQPQ